MDDYFNLPLRVLNSDWCDERVRLVTLIVFLVLVRTSMTP